jgi:hypothetical protein
MISGKKIAIAGLFSTVLGLAACGGGGGGGATEPITIAFASPPPASLSLTDTASLTAVVANDPAQAGVAWTLSCAASDCGSLNPASTASGTATVYTPPAALPSPASVNIVATSVTDGTKSVTGTIALTKAAGPALADGTYVFHLSGVDGNGAYYLAGAFKVANGVITGGEQDFSDAIYGSHDALVSDESSIKVSGGNIQLALATANSQVGVNGVETLRGTLVSTTRMLISEFDASATATGSTDLQASAVAPSGGYAFAVQGNDTNNGNPLVMGGILSFSGTSLELGGSMFDMNDGGAVLENQSFASGTVSAPDAFGRVSIALTPSTASQVPNVIFSAYIVGPGRLQLIEDQSDALNANLGGTALGQGTNAGKFTQASLAGASYAHGTTGADASNGALTLAGGFGLNADGTVGGRMAFVDAANHQGNDISGTYLVGSNGRVSLNQISLSATGVTLNFALYLDGNGNGLVLGLDQFEVSEGLAFAQVSTSALSGAYALSTLGAFSSGTFSAVGPVQVMDGTFSGATDYNNDGQLMPGLALSGSQNTSNGELALKGLNGDTTTGSTWGYYPIDGSRTLAIEVDGQQLGLLWLEAQSP